MSTGKKVEDDGKDHTKPGVNIFYMNYIIPGSEEQELIYPSKFKDIFYKDTNGLDHDMTENMLLGIDYERRDKPNFDGRTEADEAAGVMNFWNIWFI